MSPGQRPNLSEDVANSLRAMIVSGELRSGARLNEVHVAAELGISRTPLREALTRLVGEGAVEAIPRRGFFIRELSASEFVQLYGIRPILDPAALEAGGLPTRKTVERLKHLNEQLVKAANVVRRIDLDDRWHLELVAHCPNKVLVGLIEEFMAKTRRYELAYMRERPNLNAVHDEHTRIIRALRRRDLPAAVRALRQNLQTGSEPIVAWLATRQR